MGTASACSWEPPCPHAIAPNPVLHVHFDGYNPGRVYHAHWQCRSVFGFVLVLSPCISELYLEATIKVSLILTARDRQQMLDRFATALSRQSFNGPIEVIFVAQGEADFRYEPTLKAAITVTTRKTGCPVSLSRARNIGMTGIQGDIIGFPDDDCWYEPALLEKVVAYFTDNPEVDCICTNVTDPERKLSFGGKRSPGITKRISFVNVFYLGNSNGIFLRRRILESSGATFNENLGVGTSIGSGEEVEFLAQLLRAGYRIDYVGAVAVHHDVIEYGSPHVPKMYSYGFGFGHLNRTLIAGGEVSCGLYLIELIARSCAGFLLNIFRPGRRGAYWARLCGILSGLFRGSHLNSERV